MKMLNKIKFYFALTYLCIFTLSCTNKSIDIYCIYDDEVLEDGYLYNCYDRLSGKIYESGMRKDFKNVNEKILYYLDGKIKEYAFFDPLGDQRFLRAYKKNGSLITESGDFYSHTKIKENTIFLEDSIILDFYIAAPPNTYYKIFWLHQDRRLEIDWMDTIAPYQRRLTIIPKKAGNFVFHHEVEFYDTIKGSKETRNKKITFEVIPYK